MGKHLTLTDRAVIERCIAQDFSFAAIARKLCRSASTIAREIRKHRCFVERTQNFSHDCIFFRSCLRRNLCDSESHYTCFSRCKFCTEYDCRNLCNQYESVHCENLSRPPYVCTTCKSEKSCQRNHAYYTAHRAHARYLNDLSSARSGLRTSAEKLLEINNLIAPLLQKGQSLNHIFATHADKIGLSERTIYNYIDCNAFEVKNLDLPKKVLYRQRRHQKVLTKFEYQYRRGRTIEDFKSYIELHPKTTIVEMDTVKGARGSKQTLLTMIFRENNFMLIFLMKDGTQQSVEDIFNWLTLHLGLETFRQLFPVILTDNGVEFKGAHRLEFCENEARRTRLFYCDPQASWQKAQVEKNHVLIRRILPKGTSFRKLSNEDIHTVTCHVNSVAREMFDNLTPFDLMTAEKHKKLLTTLALSPIPPDEVCLKPALLKRK